MKQTVKGKKRQAEYGQADFVYRQAEMSVFNTKVAALNAAPFFRLLKNEIKLISSNVFFLWRWCFIAGIFLSWFLPIAVSEEGGSPIVLLALLPVPFLSQGGTLEKTFRTEQLLFSCTAFRYKRLVSLTVNLFFTLTVSAGCIVRFLLQGI